MSASFTFTDMSNQSWTGKHIEEGAFHIPAEIAETEQWITFKKEWDDEQEKEVKKPHATELSESKYGGYWVKWAGVDSPEQFTDYMDAYEFVEETNRRDDVSKSLDGMGFVFTEDDDFIGIDLDDCVRETDNGYEIKEFVNKFLGSVESWAELSISKTGVHILAKGELHPDYKQRDDELGIEIYTEGRFFCTSGAHIKGTPKDINESTETIHLLQEKYMDEREVSDNDVEWADFDVEEVESDDGPTDDEVVRTAKAYDDEFARLYEGSNHVDGNDGMNESDLAFCNKLSFWAQGNARQIERIWKNSGRARKKLERDDYVQKTIAKGIRSNPDDFDGKYR